MEQDAPEDYLEKSLRKDSDQEVGFGPIDPFPLLVDFF